MNRYLSDRHGYSTALQVDAARVLILVCALSSLAGCQTIDDSASTTTLPSGKAAIQSMAQLKIDTRLAMDRGHLVEPYEHSAAQLILKVLEKSPHDESVLLMRSDLSESIMAVALDLISDQRFIAAGEMLNHARVLDPDHPNLPAVTRRLTIARQSVVETLKIHPTNLSGRSSTLRRQLSILGQSIVEENATITIRSSNDASARWIYQQLSQDVAQRISATMEYGAPAAIIIRWPQPKG